jgi:hypothetical protein
MSFKIEPKTTTASLPTTALEPLADSTFSGRLAMRKWLDDKSARHQTTPGIKMDY